MATPHPHAKARVLDLEREIPWVARGLITGVIGAAVVALFFLIQDLFRGQPFWTPHALGSALILGRAVTPGEAIQSSVVAGYSAAHATVFIAAGLIAAFALADASVRQVRKGALTLMVTGTLFTAFTVAFLLFAAVFGQEVATSLGAGQVAIANLAAAGAMAAVLVVFQHPGEAGPS